MKTYARIIDGHAVDVTDQNPADLFHADVAATFVEVPDGTQTGDQLAEDGTWSKHEDPAPAAKPPYETLTPMTFYMAFTPAERIAIKKSTDAVVAEFWSTFELSVQLGKPTDPNLKSITDGLEYLVGQGILVESRIKDILLGVPQ